MRFRRVILFGLILVNCQNDKKVIQQFEAEYQKNLNALFKDASKSPLKPNDLKRFKALEFFALDSNFVVRAKLNQTPDSIFFDMRTNTDRFSKERVYGILEFKIDAQKFNLKVYQNIDALESNNKALFLPFLDDTNGNSSYGGGRYIDLSIPTSDSLWIDFNRAFNPYCAYNEKYSCPIVPRENYIPLPIEAGMKRYVEP
jgi:uncharacterized protein (DUF1684 family)